MVYLSGNIPSVSLFSIRAEILLRAKAADEIERFLQASQK